MTSVCTTTLHTNTRTQKKQNTMKNSVNDLKRKLLPNRAANKLMGTNAAGSENCCPTAAANKLIGTEAAGSEYCCPITPRTS